MAVPPFIGGTAERDRKPVRVVRVKNKTSNRKVVPLIYLALCIFAQGFFIS